MADWFKCYNDELDSKGMQYAVSVQPLIPGVWLLVRSEASKNRASKFRWAGHDFEVLGFSRKLNISVEIFNQCIKMLEDMNYLKLDGEFMHILGWKKMQSDYARGVNKGYYKRKKSTKILRRVYEDSTVRREEKRREENISTDIAAGAASGESDKPEESPEPEKPKPEPKPTTEHTAFIQGWSEAYEAINGVKYQFDGGKDGRAVKELLKMGILRIDLLEIAKSAWKMPDTYLAKQALTIHGFRNHFNQIQAGLKNANHRPIDKPNPRNAGTIAPVTDYGAAGRRKLETQAQRGVAGQMAADAATSPATQSNGG